MPMSPYVAEMRALIGHRRLFLPSVAVLAWDEDGRLLMVRNVETGEWQTVGGSIEPGEDPAEAARREALEETGLHVRLTGLRGVVGGPEFQLTYPNGDECAFTAAVYDAVPAGGELLLDGDGDEVSAARWCSAAELPGLDMNAFTRVLLARVGVL